MKDAFYKFKVKEENLYHPEIGFYTSFGVEVYSEDFKTLLGFVSDVFTDKAKAEHFADLLNECQPEPLHLEELCADFVEQEWVYF